MSEMVERVAKAQAGKRWDMFDEEYKEAARDMARAAIAAMREPTNEMLNAGFDVRAYDGIEERDSYGPPGDVWKAMIDEALK